MVLTLDSVFDRLIFADGIETPYPDDAPLISLIRIERDLDRIETPLAGAQLTILEQQTDILLDAAIPLIEAQDVAGLAQLTWVANIALQTPIYDIWQQGYRLGAEHLQAEVRAAIPARERSQFALDRGTAGLLNQFLSQGPLELRASAVDAAVQARAIQLAGNFSSDQISTLKQDLIAAVIPQADTGNPISRRELLERIEKNLNVGRFRANAIARTELTHAYNVGRVEMAKTSVLVEAFRFLAITDTRTTDICRSRNGLIIPMAEAESLAANRPPLHVACRSILSVAMPRVNRRHREWISDPGRRITNRDLVVLPDGWNQSGVSRQTPTGALEPTQATLPETAQDFIGVARTQYAEQLQQLAQYDPSDALGATLQERDMENLRKEIISRVSVERAMLDLNPIQISDRAANATAFGGVDQVRGDLLEVIRFTTGEGAYLIDNIIYDDDRAYANSRAGVINTGLRSTRTFQKRDLWHEYGHMLEDSNPVVQKAAQDWIRERATGELTPLKELTGTNYDESEVAFPDKWYSDYTGKFYPWGSTEVVSMGLEKFSDASSMAMLYNQDREHFEFILGVVTYGR